MISIPPKINTAGVDWTPIPLQQLLLVITDAIQHHRHLPIMHVNVHAINMAQDDAAFRTILNDAPVVFCDGFGVRLGARILGHRVPPRFTLPDWGWDLAALSEQHGWTLFLLGDEPGVAEQAVLRFHERHPRLQVVGTFHGFFDKQPDTTENAAVIAAINAVRPNILILGFGMPLQERWLAENWSQLDADVAITGGAAIRYIAGVTRRGPPWMTRFGLEWLARLVIEPRRLWRRYVLGNPRFLWLVVSQRLRDRTSQPPP